MDLEGCPFVIRGTADGFVKGLSAQSHTWMDFEGVPIIILGTADGFVKGLSAP